jgi:hypothetical protein
VFVLGVLGIAKVEENDNLKLVDGFKGAITNNIFHTKTNWVA